MGQRNHPAGSTPQPLRALQERIVTPVGGASSPVKARIVAATHRDLRQRVADGTFREDLFYRLNVVPIHLPPLRERLADIVPLAEYFLSPRESPKRFTAAAALIQYEWPGNVRALRNTLDRLTVTLQGNLIEAADLFSGESSTSRKIPALDWPEENLATATLNSEELLIRRALKRCGGDRAEAARLLNIHRQMLYTKVKRLQIEASDDQTPGVTEPDDQHLPRAAKPLMWIIFSRWHDRCISSLVSHTS